MKSHAPGKSLLMAVLMAGCASTPKILPKNEINEPVFHQTDFYALGASIGPTWTQREGENTFRQGMYVAPDITLEYKVSDWASYSLLPVFWNLRLTGEQYSDGAHLKIRKLHVAFHGGISGLGYSSRDHFVASGLVSLEGKYLIGPNWFLGAGLESVWGNLEKWGRRIDGVSVGVGAQMNDWNSLKLTYSLSRFEIPRSFAYGYGEIMHLDGDTRTEVGLRHTCYAWRNHVLGPELGFAYRNYSISETLQLAIGAHYAYMFD
jgi:hypothetical protein